MYNNSRRGGANQNNTRRSGGKPNFVSGGQLTPQRGGIQQPQKPAVGGQVAANKPQQQQSAPPTPTKQQIAANIAAVTRQQSAPALPTATVVPPSPMEQKPLIQPIESVPMEEAQNGEGKKDAEKKSWMNRKIPKKEKIRRRNLRLSKLLQPKNALMILHELVKNPTFNVVEAPQGQYKAILVVAGVEHVGIGKSKASAKNVASENAIKHLLKTKNVGAMEVASEDGTEKMDTFDANESPADAPLPWQQVASFALYKLFDSWGENPIQPKPEEVPKKVNSARKMPENPSTLNPIMVINQMYPNASFDELQPIGSVPNITFNIQVNVDGKTFNGSGPSKKAAKKLAAYAACHTLLGINYPPEEYIPGQ